LIPRLKAYYLIQNPIKVILSEPPESPIKNYQPFSLQKLLGGSHTVLPLFSELLV